MKIVVLDGYTLNPGDLDWKGLEALGELIVYDRIGLEEEKIIEAIDNAEIIFTNKTPLSKHILDAAKTVKYIGVLATGYNVVDVKSAKENGIVVTNIPAYGTAAVAQYTLALLLEMCHHIGEHSKSVSKGAWLENSDFCFWKYPLVELAGKTIGIIGFGRIGQATAKLASAFGMRVIVYSRTHYSNLGFDAFSYVTLDELLSTSDVISLHCPLTEDTKEMIDKTTIAKMKKSAFLINTSRGPLIHEQDLTDALNANTIAGAALDVVSVEPMQKENPLLKAKNCIITPHIAWASKEARARLMDVAVKNLEAFLEGNLVNTVN